MKLFTVKKAAQILGCSTNTLYKYLSEGRIKSSRGSAQQGRFRIPQSSLEQFLGISLDENQLERPTTVNPKLMPIKTKTKLPRLLVRLLIGLGFLLILLDLVVSQTVNVSTQVTRLLFLTIALLLAYQEGGYGA
jgi:excisionase family DNA binding protein